MSACVCACARARMHAGIGGWEWATCAAAGGWRDGNPGLDGAMFVWTIIVDAGLFGPSHSAGPIASARRASVASVKVAGGTAVSSLSVL